MASVCVALDGGAGEGCGPGAFADVPADGLVVVGGFHAGGGRGRGVGHEYSEVGVGAGGAAQGEFDAVSGFGHEGLQVRGGGRVQERIGGGRRAVESGGLEFDRVTASANTDADGGPPVLELAGDGPPPGAFNGTVDGCVGGVEVGRQRVADGDVGGQCHENYLQRSYV